MLEERAVDCPYCGEPFTPVVDCSEGSHTAIQDCPVCCRPIELRVVVDHDGALTGIEAAREDD